MAPDGAGLPTRPPADSHGAVGVAFVGCGYAADFYGPTMPNYPHLSVKGAFDIEPDRAASFAGAYGGRAYESFEQVLADPEVDIVANLTPVSRHYSVTKAALLAGKHVYSEKPISPDLDQATELVAIAKERGLLLSSAPSTVFSQSAQTLIQAVGDGVIGTPRLVYASLDMGALAFMPYTEWRSRRGVPWPYWDEVPNGCVLEHAGYQLSWLLAMFGPVARMAAHTALLLDGEWPEPAEVAPDVCIGFLEFASGVVCRISIGWVAPADMALTVMGDQGTLAVDDVWQASSPVLLRRRVRESGKTNGYLAEAEALPFVIPPAQYRYADTHDLTVGAGIADMGQALLKGEQPFLTADYCLHILDVTLRLAAGRGAMEDVTGTGFDDRQLLRRRAAAL